MLRVSAPSSGAFCAPRRKLSRKYGVLSRMRRWRGQMLVRRPRCTRAGSYSLHQRQYRQDEGEARQQDGCDEQGPFAAMLDELLLRGRVDVVAIVAGCPEDPPGDHAAKDPGITHAQLDKRLSRRRIGGAGIGEPAHQPVLSPDDHRTCHVSNRRWTCQPSCLLRHLTAGRRR